MKYLIDTDWVVDYLDAKRAAVQLLASLGHEGLAISLITFGEIYEGIYFGIDPQLGEVRFLQFLSWVDVLDLDYEIMRRYTRIRGDLRSRGQLVGDPDILIAATAIHHDLILVTRNRRHYDRIPNLRLYQTP